jgi:hypothetical protein
MGGDHGGFQIAVTKQLLNCANSDICLQEMAGKTVAEGMSRGPLAESNPANRHLDRPRRYGFMQDLSKRAGS